MSFVIITTLLNHLIFLFLFILNHFLFFKITMLGFYNQTRENFIYNYYYYSSYYFYFYFYFEVFGHDMTYTMRYYCIFLIICRNSSK